MPLEITHVQSAIFRVTDVMGLLLLAFSATSTFSPQDQLAVSVSLASSVLLETHLVPSAMFHAVDVTRILLLAYPAPSTMSL